MDIRKTVIKPCHLMDYWFRRRNEVRLKPAQIIIAWSTLLSHIKGLELQF